MVLIFEERVASNPNIFFHLQKIWYWAINNRISAFPIGSQVHVFVPEKWLRENIMNTSYFTCTLPTKLLAMIPRPPASGCVDQVFWVIRNHGTVKTVALWKSHLDSLLFQPKAHLINTWGQNLSFVPNLLTFWSTCHLLRDLSFLWTNFLMWLCIIGRTSKCLIYYQSFLESNSIKKASCPDKHWKAKNLQQILQYTFCLVEIYDATPKKPRCFDLNQDNKSQPP